MSTEPKHQGSIGVAMKRKEDPRFIQGKGTLRRRHFATGHAVFGASAKPIPAC